VAGVHLLITLYLCSLEVSTSGTHLVLFLWFTFPSGLSLGRVILLGLSAKVNSFFSHSKPNQQFSMSVDRGNERGLHLHFHHNHVRGIAVFK